MAQQGWAKFSFHILYFQPYSIFGGDDKCVFAKFDRIYCLLANGDRVLLQKCEQRQF